MKKVECDRCGTMVDADVLPAKVVPVARHVQLELSQDIVDKLRVVFDALNNFKLTPSNAVPFFVSGKFVGAIRHDLIKYFEQFTTYLDFERDANRITAVDFTKEYSSLEDRTFAFHKMLMELKEIPDIHALKGWRNELNDISTGFNHGTLFKMERAAVPLIGARQYGVHVNGYVEGDDGLISMWIAKRSATKETFPSKMDNFCGGGLGVGYSIWQCVAKELEEETSFKANPETQELQPAGAVSICSEDERGICCCTEFCFDLKLPFNFTPSNTDGEVEAFYLCDLPKVARMLAAGDFMPSAAAVIFDFFVRRGFITPSQFKEYGDIVTGLHRTDMRMTIQKLSHASDKE